MNVLLHGVPRIERRWGRSVQRGWITPPISARELQSWAAFERVNGPILSQERLEVASGIVAMTIAAGYSDGSRRLKLADFMAHWDDKADYYAQTPEDMMAAMDSIARKGTPKDA